ncbi:hypothetical protein BIV57_06620 [Mangrovactinospora gilvigrisea]|uniref:HTH tetR-type domain-containing protein n=1 Tax=Mangrovactinospora gilvigrisea TaxID=1428644 RepID=A0A1J7BI28_9ACTN|nr:TetR family transcriptional regulator [Mangrovactinospora gilvigrisea]OIV38327.1 hypothetical protein BIV57_06620 [Mangrovactinospora gilvigrisea]
MTRPVRKDALRNYQRLLETAEHAFTAHGTHAPLEQIARDAGVGIGTLYRHFPNRDALLAALLQERWIDQAALAEKLHEEDGDPVEALRTWLTAVARGTLLYRDLPDACLRLMSDPESEMHRAWKQVRDGGDRLLERARRVGGVRSDVTTVEMFALVHGAIAALHKSAAHHPGTVSDASRMIDLLIDGIAAPTAPRHPST